MTQTLVDYAGVEDGREVYTMTIHIPDAPPADRDAASSQIESIAKFYDMNVSPVLTEEQAHALLTYRDFGRACAEKLFPRLHSRRARTVARMFAAFVSADPAIAADVIAWMDARFEGDDDPDDTADALATMKHYPALQQFAAALGTDFAGRTQLFKR